jgi:hypothetical protein
MKKPMCLFLYMLLLAACGQPADKPATGSDPANAQKDSVTNPANKIPSERDSVRPEPIAEYKEKTENPINDWYFSVRLYETPKTFYYLIKLQYEEIRGEDTLKLPNFGITPNPVIQKGPDKYSCIIGFTDKENNFREYKKVFVKDNVVKITALKHYAVSTR